MRTSLPGDAAEGVVHENSHLKTLLSGQVDVGTKARLGLVECQRAVFQKEFTTEHTEGTEKKAQLTPRWAKTARQSGRTGVV